MIVYFNNLGQVKEIINNESIREGNFNVNSIYFYLEETAILSLFEVVWKDRETTTIVNNPKKYNVEIPYNPKADYKYFKEYNTYECYKVDIPTNGVLDSEGLKTASIRIKVQGSDTINTLGIITFLVEQSNVLPTQSISVSQYDYLLTVIGQETKQTVIGVGDEELVDGKDVSGRFDNDNFLLSRHGGVLTIAYVSNLTERILFDANLLNNVITLANSTQSALESTQALVNTINTELENLKNTSATKEELGNYYTKTEINELFITKRFHYEIVETLPTVGESNVLYLVLKEKTTTGNVYTEYIWLEKDKRYEEIGDTGVDLTGYVQGNGLDKDYLIIGNGDSKIIKSSKTLTELLAELNSKVNQTTYENLVKVVPTDIDYNGGFTLMHDTTEIAGQTSKVKLGTNLTYDPATKTINASGGETNEKYTNTKATPYTVGGIKAGSTFDNKTMTEMWNSLLYPFVAPSNLRLTIDSSVQTGVIEKGITISPSATTKLAWSMNGNDGTITKIEFFKNDVSVKTYQAESLSTSGYTEWGTEFGTISSNTNIKYKATYKENTSDILTSNSITWTFVDPYFYGVGASGVSVVNLTKSITTKGDKTYSFTTTNNYIYFAYPANYGSLTSIKDSNGFENITGFNKTTVSLTVASGQVDYLVYQSKAQSTQSNFVLTFKY